MESKVRYGADDCLSRLKSICEMDKPCSGCSFRQCLFGLLPLVQRCVAVKSCAKCWIRPARGGIVQKLCVENVQPARYSCRVQATTQSGAQSICKRCRIAFHVLLAMGFLHKVMLFINPGSPRAGSSISIPIKAWLGYAKRASSSPRRPCRRTKTDVCPVICRCHPGRLHSFGRVRHDVSMSSVA